jgi:Mg2+-importing ATPase
MTSLSARPSGLSSDEAAERLLRVGPNEIARGRKRGLLLQLLLKFTNPLIVVLMAIALLSLFFGERISALLVLAMAVLSVLLSFVQELRAGQAAEKLRAMVRTRTTIQRDGAPQEIDLREVVPGDVVILQAGDMIPADLRLSAAKDLFINQSSLTGESLPVEKTAEVPSAEELRNIAFMGSSVVSGTGQGIVLRTGTSTQFGELSQRLVQQRSETSFERGLRGFVGLMLKLMVVLVVVIFGVNAIFKHSLLDSLLFALAVAVGLTPEMLPMLVALNLSKGALALSRRKVIVKQLNSIQNLGAADILCTDKTGTLTLDEVVLERHCDVIRREDESVLELAYLNSHHQTGLKNLLDRAILKHDPDRFTVGEKIDEIPFDFSRRIMSVVVGRERRHQLICKGAPEEIFKRCVSYELDGDLLPMEDLVVADLKEELDELNRDGFRVLAVAHRNIESPKSAYSRDDERDLILRGYLAFLDPPKPSSREALAAMARHGVECKILTGDNALVTLKICRDVGLDVRGLLTGDQVEALSDESLAPRLETTTVFARLSPLQKERVIRLLQKNGHTVGFMGDGINDAPALKAADVGISVDNAVDVARESADMILLEKDLRVLEEGIMEGRKTFANILKYVRMGASSNFGNMLSMTGASLALPFLPMLPPQVLLNNFLYDISQVGLPTDAVDDDQIARPLRWSITEVRRYMMVFGPLSSLFDFLTFGLLALLFHRAPHFQAAFHTGWFLESLASQTLVVYVIRTNRRPFLDSRPSPGLVLTTLLVLSLAVAIPFSPLGAPLGFVRLPPVFAVCLLLLLSAYLLLAQRLKVWYLHRLTSPGGPIKSSR